MEFNRSVDISQLPQANIGRSVFDLSFPSYTTCNVGDIIPIYLEDVLPGDSFQVKSSYLARLQTLLTPMMGQIYLDQYYFFVPNRLVWSHWQEFMGENKTGYWTQPSTYEEPTAIAYATAGNGIKQYSSKSVGDYMGVPTLVDLTHRSCPSALPFRGLALIYNEYLRDQNVDDPVAITTGDVAPIVAAGTDLTTNANILSYFQTGLTKPLKANKYHDLFTSCLPSPLKGPESVVPLGGTIPVIAFNNAFADASLKDPSEGKYYPVTMKTFTGATGTSLSGINASQNVGVNSSGQMSRETGSTTMGTSTQHPVFNNLGVNLGQATLATINDLRLSFATQRYYEALARSGSRYTEILSGLFGVESPDARLQRPEYLGGSHSVLNVEQIVQTSESSASSPLGETGAYSLSYDSDFAFEKSFVEHGWIIGIAIVRYEHNYQQGIRKNLTRRSKFDYYWPQFANIGEQPVHSAEIYCDNANEDRVFGYQEAWYEYRYRNTANVSGEMRSNYSTSLDVWHLADDYSSRPTLSSSWMKEDKSNVDRVLTVNSSVADQVLLNFYFDVKATRPLPVYSIPGGLDMR